MIQRVTSLQRIDQYWAAFLGCSTAQLNTTKPIVFRTSRIKGIAAVKKRAWVIALNDALPQHVGFDFIAIADDPDLNDADREDRLHRLCHNLHLAAPYGPSILHYLGSGGLSQLAYEFESRELSVDDEPILQAFKQKLAFSPEYTLTMPDLFPYALGYFDKDTLVAVGTVRVWEDLLAEVFIDTLDEYRAQGIGSCLAFNITQWILNATSWIPQYDSEATNLASLTIAARLGFSPYGKFFVTGSGLMITTA